MNSFRVTKGVLIACVVLIICLAGACAYKGGMVLPDVLVPNATYVGSEECAICHEDVFEYYRKTIHSKVRSFSWQAGQGDAKVPWAGQCPHSIERQD